MLTHSGTCTVLIWYSFNAGAIRT